MDSGGISIISPPGVTEHSVGKSKSIGITLRSNSGFQTAKEKLRTTWLKSLVEEECTWWEIFLQCLAEIMGTAILVFLGCLSCVGSLNFTPEVVNIALSFGFAVMIAIQAVGHISGAHINPAITLLAVLMGRISLQKSLLYMISQCFGSFVGYALLHAISPDMVHDGEPENAHKFCVTDLNERVSALQGFLAEALATGTLGLMVCGVWDPRNASNTDSAPIKFGMCIAALVFCFIPYTGCSLNPARSFGPALWTGYWANHWVYWTGPFTGIIVVALLYRTFFQYKSETDE